MGELKSGYKSSLSLLSRARGLCLRHRPLLDSGRSETINRFSDQSGMGLTGPTDRVCSNECTDPRAIGNSRGKSIDAAFTLFLSPTARSAADPSQSRLTWPFHFVKNERYTRRHTHGTRATTSEAISANGERRRVRQGETASEHNSSRINTLIRLSSQPSHH